MPTHYDLRQKYKKWAHRRDARKRRRRKGRKRRRSRSRGRAKKSSAGSTTEGMLISLLNQLMVGSRTPAKKHGENVITGASGAVAPDALAPIRSRMQHELYKKERGRDGAGTGAGAGAAAAAGIVRAPPPPWVNRYPPVRSYPPARARSPSPRPGGYL